MDDLIQTEEINNSNKKRRLIISIISVVLVVILAVTSALLVKKYVLTTFIVDGISMYPTLDGGDGANLEGSSQEERTNGEVLYLNKIAKINRGDIVVFSPNWESLLDSNGNYKSLVKRVIAIGGDHLQIIDNIVYLNGEKLDEPYINNGIVLYSNLDVIIENGNIFCMGDNRMHSADCRIYGQISLNTVVGKCWLIKGIDGKLRKP